MIRLPRLAGTAILIAVAATFGASTFAVAQQSGGGSNTAALTESSVDRLTDGTVVVTLVATGDLAGVTTFKFRPSGNGTYDGEWAIEVAHTEFTDPATGIEPPDDDSIDPETGKPHVTPEFFRIIHRGTLNGSIAGAQLTFDPTGVLTGFTAPLTIVAGSNEFAGAAGAGTASATQSVNPPATAAHPSTTGALALSF